MPSPMKFYALMMFIIVSAILIYIIWIKPTISIIQNSKDIYQSSLDKMDKTYGTSKKESEQSAQSSLDAWNASVNKMYKIIIETLFGYSLLLFNYYDPRSNLYVTGGTNIVLIGCMIFEYASNLLNDWLKHMFNDISSSASKNTQDNTGQHHKMLALFISGIMCIASILGKLKYGDDLFLTSAAASFVLSMLTLFNANFNSIAALIGFSILGLLSVVASIYYSSPMLFSVFVISAIISILSAFNVSSFDSEPYIFILFFIANIPFVTLFMYSLDFKNSKNDSLYIPLLIAFYILSIIILTILGAVDLTLNTNLYIILSFIGASILYYAKSLQDSIYKTFLLVVTMIIFFFIALHYVLVSQQWIVYLFAFILIMYFIMKRVPLPSAGQGVQAVSKITRKEILLISGEILFVLTYIYVRSLVKKVYTIHGQLIVNNPVSLHEISVVKIDKSVKYDYGLSFWLYIDPMNPSSSPQATNYTPIFSYGDAPKVTYNSMLNTLRIGIKTDSNKIKKVDEIKKLPLQKWNHIVLNYLNGTCDVFVNSELHASKIEVIPMNEKDRIFEIGAEDGIQGKLCNVIFFQEHLTGVKIKELYTEFSYKNPPTI